MKTILLLLISAAAMCGQVITPGGVTRAHDSPTTIACTAGSATPGAYVYSNGGTDQLYTCGPGGFYIESPGGSTSTLDGSGTYAGGAAGANTIKTTAPGTGAVLRNQNAENSDIMKATQFNVDPTGGSDSTVGLQQMLAQAVAIGGKKPYLPCGTYNITSTSGNSALTINKSYMSLVGESKSCVNLAYSGSGIAITVVTNPFTTLPVGEIAGFTLTGTSSGQVGIYTGQMDSVWMHDIVVTGFTTGDDIEIVGDGSNTGGSFQERNFYQNIIVANAVHGFHLKNVNTNPDNSFAYGNYIGIHANADGGQTGFFIDTGVFFGSNQFDITCNLTGYNVSSASPVCVENAGDIHDGTFIIEGEYDTGAGTGTPYSIKNDSTGFIEADGYNTLAGAGVLNSNSGTPVRFGKYSAQVYDQGTYTLNGAAASPSLLFLNPGLGALGGNVGSLVNVGASVASPFVGCQNTTGNKFMLLTGASNALISGATLPWEIDCDTGNEFLNGGTFNISAGGATSTLKQYYNGFGVVGNTLGGTVNPIFTVQYGTQTGFGLGQSELYVSPNGIVETFNNILDGGDGRFDIGGGAFHIDSGGNITHATSIVDSSLTSGNCVQASTGGLLTTTSSPCGSGSSYAGTGTATFAPQAGAGTGATAVCATSHVCDSFSGEVTLTSGSVGTPATGSQLIITLPITRTNLPNCSVDVYGGSTFLGASKTVTTSTITISSGVALTFATAYTVDYVCGGQ